MTAALAAVTAVLLVASSSAWRSQRFDFHDHGFDGQFDGHALGTAGIGGQ